MRRKLVLLLCVLLCPASFAKEKYSVPGPIRLDRDGEKWAEKTLHKLSTEEKVGQLFMIWVRAEFLNVNSPQYLQLRDTMNKYHVGAFGMTRTRRFSIATSPTKRQCCLTVCNRTRSCRC
jgi:hypothetical protein